MGEVGGSESWREELVSLMQETGMKFTTTGEANARSAFEPEKFEFRSPEVPEEGKSESLQVQIKEFAKAWGEMVGEFGKGCRAVVEQNLLTENSYIVKKSRGPLSEVSKGLRFLNEFLPEDRDPKHSCFVIFFVFILTLAAIGANCNNNKESSSILEKNVHIPPPNAVRILLPDGRNLAYHEVGVPAARARYSIIVIHGFLFSRLAGIPGVKLTLLEEFGVRLISYDRPGYGESDPHPDRNLNSSAHDILYLADAIGIKHKFWILGYSDSAMHVWAALNYIPHRVAGAAMFGPLVNMYDSSLTKEEFSTIREGWTRRRRFMVYLARRCPKLLDYLYRRMFLSGKLGQIDKWLSLSLGKKDMDVIGNTDFQEMWQRNFGETIRQGSTTPLIEEAKLQVSHWGFTLFDLQAKNKCPGKGIIPWLRSMYGQVQCQQTGYRGPVHIWQGMDDHVVPPEMTNYIARVLPETFVHRLSDEGHYSYLFLCEKCHKQIFLTLFGTPLGPLEAIDEIVEGSDKETSFADKFPTF